MRNRVGDVNDRRQLKAFCGGRMVMVLDGFHDDFGNLPLAQETAANVGVIATEDGLFRMRQILSFALYQPVNLNPGSIPINLTIAESVSQKRLPAYTSATAGATLVAV